MLFDNQDSPITAERVATNLLRQANMQFRRELQAAQRDFDSVWNRSDDLTGVEILKAMGTSAQAATTSAWLRVQMLVSVATVLGRPELVELSNLVPTQELQFNEDGSLK